ncbi:phosphatase PAP2 family protein [Candidatus Woesearchaeota archaeon]|nr:phosphatase PAP2 family protein [Candidatus Woesearchaeota archaeon]
MIIQKYTYQFFRDISTLGGIFFYGFILIFLLIINQYELFKKLFIALIIVYFFAIILRYFFFKERPVKEKYTNLIEKIDSSSFPSLHAGRASLYSLFAYYNLNFNLFIFILIISLIILYSRIYLKKHYVKDILAGVLIGILAFYISNSLIIF